MSWRCEESANMTCGCSASMAVSRMQVTDNPDVFDVHPASLPTAGRSRSSGPNGRTVRAACGSAARMAIRRGRW